MSKHTDTDNNRRTIIKTFGISAVALGAASAPAAAHPHDNGQGQGNSNSQSDAEDEEQSPGSGEGQWCCSCGFAPQGRRQGPGYRRGYPHERDDTEWDGWQPGDGQPPWAGGDDEDENEEVDEEPEETEPPENPDDDENGDDTPDEGEQPPEDAPEEDDDTDEDDDENEDEDSLDDEEIAEQIEQRIHALVNEYRATQDAPELAFDDELAEVAREHSEDMVEEDYFSHVSPDGDGPGDRLEDAGIECNGWAENIAGESGQPVTEDDVGSVANSMVSGWINSPNHRENILGNYDSEGVGASVDGGDVYVTQLFCSEE